MKLKIEFAVAGVILGILSSILLISPITGIADNGDFARIMNSTGLYYLSDVHTDRYFGYVNRLYGMGSIIPMGGGYLSTGIPLVLLAVNICKSLSSIGLIFFDIRFLATIYIIVLSASLYLISKGIRILSGIFAFGCSLLAVIIFCDTGYTAYFNSLYGEPVTFVFLLLMAGAALIMANTARPALWMLIVFCTGALFFAGAKVQNSPAGILAALLCIRLVWLRKDSAWRRISIAAAAAAVSVSLVCYVSVSKDIKICNKYQTVFYGILKDSPDPAKDLVELGLDPSLAPLAGTNYFMKSYPIDIRNEGFKEMLYDRISYIDILTFYIKHPGRFIDKLGISAVNGFRLKQGFGNYEKYTGIEYKQTSDVLSFWSDFKMDSLPHSLLFIAVYFSAVFLLLIYEYKKAKSPEKRFFIEFMMAVALIGVMQFILPVMADGEADLSKHLFLFNLSFDVLFAAMLVYVPAKSAAIVKWLKIRRMQAKLETE